MKSETDKFAKKSFTYGEKVLICVLGGIGVSALVLAFVAVDKYCEQFNDLFPLKEIEDWGQLGDFFGGVLNPTFSFFTLCGLLFTLILQARELRLSREVADASAKALELSQIEMANSARALERQNKAIELQRVDQSFFSWLENCQFLLSQPKCREELQAFSDSLTGLGARKQVEKLEVLLRDGLGSDHTDMALRHRFELDDSDRGEVIAMALYSVEFKCDDAESDASSAIASVFELLHWVLRAAPPEARDRFIGILRAQLSKPQLVMLLAKYQLQDMMLTEDEVEGAMLFQRLKVSEYPLLDFLTKCHMAI